MRTTHRTSDLGRRARAAAGTSRSTRRTRITGNRCSRSAPLSSTCRLTIRLAGRERAIPSEPRPKGVDALPTYRIPYESLDPLTIGSADDESKVYRDELQLEVD